MRLSFKGIRSGIVNYLKEATNAKITNTNLKQFIVKHAGWSSDSSDYASPESDLSEVKSAIETDSYIKVALDKTFQLIMKAGYRLSSKNEKALEYLKQRLNIMAFGTGIPFDILLEETARDLTYYANAFWVKSRIDKIQGGLQAKPILGKKPVGGYFRMDPTTIEIKRDNNGALTGYKQTGGSNEVEFKAEDVVHFYTDREASNNFGTPRVIAALEDIKILRKIEGNTLSLIYRYAIPLYHMIIGLPQENMQATEKEITDAQNEINKMPQDGVLITNERVQFKAIGAEGKALDIGPYLDYNEKRVFTALNVSEAMMGRGGSKQDADSMEGMMHDTVKYYQRMLSVFIKNNVFNELLLEGGFNPIFNEDDVVEFDWNEINLDTKVKMENHELLKFQSNAITFEELRRALGRPADGVDESRLFSQMITQKNALELINAKNNLAVSSDDGNQKNGKTTKSVPSGAAKNIAQPTNQNGTTSAKVKESLNLSEAKNDTDTKKTEKNIKKYEADYKKICKIYQHLRNDTVERGNLSTKNMTKYTALIQDELKKYIADYAENGYAKSQLSGKKAVNSDGTEFISEEINKLADKTVERFIDDMSVKIKSKNKSIDDCFIFMEYRLRFACNFLSQKAYWYGFVKGCAVRGAKRLTIKLSDDHKKEHKSVIHTDNFNIDNIPPFSPYCTCSIVTPSKLGAKNK